MRTTLQELEQTHKTDLAAESAIRGNVEQGLFDQLRNNMAKYVVDPKILEPKKTKKKIESPLDKENTKIHGEI